MRKVCKQKIRKRGLWDGSTWATTSHGNLFFCLFLPSDKLVLFLFPGIPTGDPAMVAFYDKRIYKTVTIEVIVPKWPLISRKEIASEYDKIINFAFYDERIYKKLRLKELSLSDWRSVAQREDSN